MRFMLRVEVADVTADYAVLGEPMRAESVEGEPVAWVDSWPGPVGDTALYGPPSEGHPVAVAVQLDDVVRLRREAQQTAEAAQSARAEAELRVELLRQF